MILHNQLMIYGLTGSRMGMFMGLYSTLCCSSFSCEGGLMLWYASLYVLVPKTVFYQTVFPTLYGETFVAVGLRNWLMLLTPHSLTKWPMQSGQAMLICITRVLFLHTSVKVSCEACEGGLALQAFTMQACYRC